MRTPDKPGQIRVSEVRTPRLRHHVLFSGDGDGPVVVFQIAPVLEPVLAKAPSATGRGL
jgi:hypothetical protein